MATLSVVATLETSNVPPRVKVVITDTGTPTIFTVTPTRTDQNGLVTPLRTSNGAPLTLVTSGSNRVGTVYDYEMPYGLPVTYSTTLQPTNKSASVTVNDSRIWLINPGVPDRSTTIRVADWGSQTRKVSQGVFYPLGRAEAVTISDGKRKSSSGTLTLLTMTDVELVALNEALSDASVLLLNVSPTLSTGWTSSYLAIGDVTESRVTKFTKQPDRYWELPYNVVTPPVGGSQSQWTWADVLATSPTWQDLLTNYGTWANVQAPTT